MNVQDNSSTKGGVIRKLKTGYSFAICKKVIE